MTAEDDLELVAPPSGRRDRLADARSALDATDDRDHDHRRGWEHCPVCGKRDDPAEPVAP